MQFAEVAKYYLFQPNPRAPVVYALLFVLFADVPATPHFLISVNINLEFFNSTQKLRKARNSVINPGINQYYQLNDGTDGGFFCEDFTSLYTI